MKKIKKMRKEFEKWLNIPHVLLLNKRLVTENKIKDELIEEQVTRIMFLQTNNDKLNHQVIKLKKENEILELANKNTYETFEDIKYEYELEIEKLKKEIEKYETN